MSGGVPSINFYGMLNSIGDNLTAAGKQSALADIGQQVRSGTLDATKAAGALIEAGELPTGLALLKMGKEDADSQWFQRGLAGIGGTAPSSGTTAGGPTPTASTDGGAAPASRALPSFAQSDFGARGRALFDGLVQRGLTPVMAAGVLGNLHGESGFNPTIGGDNGTSFGLAQWRGDRLTALKNLASTTGRDWRDPEVQLDHLVAELKGPEARAHQALQAARTPGEASDAFMRHFERPAEWAMRQSGPKRAAFAERALISFGGQAAPSQGRPGQVAQAPRPSPAVLDYSDGATGPVAMAMPSLPAAPQQSGAQVAAADLPAENGRPVQFVIPPAPRSSEVDGAQPSPATPNATPQAVGPATVASIERSPLTQRIPFLMQAVARQNLPAGQRELAKTLLVQALEESKATPEQRDYMLARAQGFTGTFLDYKDRTRRSLDDKRPTSIQEYEYAAQQERADGGTPANYTDWRRANSNASRAQTNVSVDNKGPNAYDVDAAKEARKRFGEIQASGRSASSTIGTLNLMERMIDDPRFYSGFGGEAQKRVNQLLVRIGWADANAASPAEVFEGLGRKAVLDRLGGSLGNGISNADVSFITGTVASLANTPEGNRQMIAYARQLAEREQVIAKMARDYARAHNGRLDDGFEEVLAQFAEANPLFAQSQGPARPSPNERAAPQQPQVPASPAPDRSAIEAGNPVRVASPEEAMKLPKGTLFTTPDGRTMRVR